MLICPRAQLNFFHLGRLLMAPVLVVLLAQLELILPVVHNAAYGRHRRGRDLDKIVTIFLCLLEGIRRKENAELFAFRTDDPDFSYSDFPINS